MFDSALKRLTAVGILMACSFMALYSKIQNTMLHEQCSFERVAGGLLVKAVDCGSKDPGLQSH